MSETIKVIKENITREINPARKAEYIAKGYIAAETPEIEVAKEPGGEGDDESTANPYVKMKTAELEEEALRLEVDLSDCTNNVQRAAKLWEASIAAGGEDE